MFAFKDRQFCHATWNMLMFSRTCYSEEHFFLQGLNSRRTNASPTHSLFTLAKHWFTACTVLPISVHLVYFCLNFFLGGLFREQEETHFYQRTSIRSRVPEKIEENKGEQNLCQIWSSGKDCTGYRAIDSLWRNQSPSVPRKMRLWCINTWPRNEKQKPEVKINAMWCDQL